MKNKAWEVWVVDAGSLKCVSDGTHKQCRRKAEKLRICNEDIALVLPKSIPPVESEPLTLVPMERIYPVGTKQALKRLLQNAIRLIDADEINAADDLGILCAHIQTIAYVSKDSSENQDAFIYGFHGDWQDHAVCAALQGGDNAIERNAWATWIEDTSMRHIGSVPDESNEEEEEPEDSVDQIAV